MIGCKLNMFINIKMVSETCNLQDIINNIKNQIYLQKTKNQTGGNKKKKSRKNNYKNKKNSKKDEKSKKKKWWLRRRCGI